MLEDMLQETVIYQYIKQQGVAEGQQQGVAEGVEKGLQQGLEQGLQQELQDLRGLLLSSIRSKFPDLIPLVTKPISGLASAEVLMDLTLKVIASETPEEFYKILVCL